MTGPSTARRALCARVAVLGPTRARPSPGSGPLTEPRRPRLPRRLRAGLAAEGAQRRHGRLLQQSGREWPRGRRRLRTQPAAACEEPSAGGRRPVRRAPRQRQRRLDPSVQTGARTWFLLPREAGPAPRRVRAPAQQEPFLPRRRRRKRAFAAPAATQARPRASGSCPVHSSRGAGCQERGAPRTPTLPTDRTGGGGGTRVLPWNPGSGRPSAAAQTANPGLCVPPGPREGPREEPGGVAAHTMVTSGVTRSWAWRVPGLAVNQARSWGQHPDLGCYISTVYRVTRVERGAAPAPWRACATRAPAEEGAAKRVPLPTSPPVRPPRWASHPEPPLLHQRAAGTVTLGLSNPTDGSDSGSRGHPRTNAGARPQPRRGPARAPRAPGHRPEVPQRPTSPSAPPESAQTVNRIKPARLGTAGWTRSPDCTLQATRTPAGSPGGTPALATHPVSL